jgi:hypothetical protein
MASEGMKTMIDSSGGCHCGAVRFQVELPNPLQAHRCNCSICQKSGFVHVFVERSRFRLIQGREALLEYQFHTRTARHLFCRFCGIKSYYVPRSHPDGFSVNFNCLDLPDAIDVTFDDFDGANWTQSIGCLRRAAGAEENG